MDHEQKPLGLDATVGASQQLATGLHAATRRVIYDLLESPDLDTLYQLWLGLALRLEGELLDWHKLTTDQLFEQATINYLARMDAAWEAVDGRLP